MNRLAGRLPSNIMALLRWSLVVMCAIAGFLAPWIVLLAAHVSRDMALAMSPIVSAAVLAGLTVWASEKPENDHGGVGATSKAATTVRQPQPGQLTRAEVAAALGGTVLVGDIPREPVAFQNRTALLSRLQDPLEDERVTVVSAVTGSRGVGKTQLAGAYARQCIAGRWALVAWIIAEDIAGVQAGLAELAERVGVRSPGQDVELAALAARDYLEQITGPSLVIFDNATDPDEVARWLPRVGRTRIVITSTLRTFVALGTTVDVDVFSPGEAIAYLRQRLPAMASADAALLAQELGYLPLALSQAAWLITIQGLAAADYVDRLRTIAVGQMLGRVPGEPYPRGMAQAVLLSLAEAESIAPDAPLGDLANLISVLSPGGVGRDLLVQAVYARTPATSARDVDAALGALAACSLITYTLDGTAVIMHRLVQRVVRDRLRDHGDLLDTTSRAAEAMGTVLGASGNDAESLEMANSSVDQINALWSAALPDMVAPLASSAADQVVELLDLRIRAISLLTFSDQTARAIALGIEVLADVRRLLPEDEERAFRAMTRLGTAYGTAWDHAHAVARLRDSVNGFKRIFGPDARQTLGAMNELGRFAEAAGLLDEAADVLESALEANLRIFGQNAEDTLVAQVNLANAYRAAGRVEESIELLERNLADNIEAHGKDHSQTINARGELARSYTRVGRTDEAVALLRENIEECRRLYGAANRTELFWRVHLAEAFSAAGKQSEAIDIYTATVADMAQQMRPDHPQTLEARVKRARAYLADTQPRRATEELEDVHIQMIKVLGPDHPRTLNTARFLARAYAQSGRRQEALTLITDTLDGYQRVLGVGHPYTADIEEENRRISSCDPRSRRFPRLHIGRR